MIKMFIATQRKQGTSHENFCDYALNVHAKTVCSAPAYSLPSGYVQNHVFNGLYTVDKNHLFERDGIIEGFYENIHAIEKQEEEPYFQTVIPKDELNFANRDTTLAAFFEEKILSGTADNQSYPFKIFYIFQKQEMCEYDKFIQMILKCHNIALKTISSADSMIKCQIIDLQSGEIQHRHAHNDIMAMESVIELWFSCKSDASYISELYWKIFWGEADAAKDIFVNDHCFWLSSQAHIII